MTSFLQDLRFALRSLARAPGFTAVAATCMALGIAANVFVYSPVNAILIRPLPYEDSPRLMHLNTWDTSRAKENWASWSWPDFQDVKDGTSAQFVATGAYRNGAWNLGGLEEPERIQGARVTSSLFPMLGLRPALGRFFTEGEDLEGRVVILGHGLWQRKFGADSTVVGRGVTLNGVPYTVAGVMQEGIRFPEIEEIWLPPEPSAEQRANRDASMWQFIARLAPGVSREDAERRVQALMSGLAERFPDSNRRRSAWILPLNDDIRMEVRSIFLTMVGAVAFVLLIACSNVANLLLARGSGRQRELAVRLSMGASRGRLVRQLLTESLLLSVLGGALGILLGTWGVHAFTQWAMPTTVPFWMRFDVDATVLWLTTAITLVSGILFGVIPALRLTRPDLARTIKESGGRGGSAHGSLGRLRAGLVVGQMALSLVLLAGAALMVQSFLRSQQARLGFDARQLLTGSVTLTGERYATDSARSAARAALASAIRAVPGVRDVAIAGWIPIGECCSADAWRLPGQDDDPADRRVATLNAVSAGYFRSMGVPLLRGREFGADDRVGSAKVAVISRSLAAMAWGDRDPIGQPILLGRDSTPTTIVGVVGDVVVRKVTERSRFEHIYVPVDQGWFTQAGLLIRSSGDPGGLVAGVRRAVAGFDPDLPIARLHDMGFVIRDRMFEGRVYGTMFAVFGVAALALACIGLYGVMAFSVAQRTQEVGVRMALGAQARDVLRLVLGGGIRLVAVSVAIGIPAAIGLAQVLRGSLYGISATDPLTFGVVPLVLALVALLASLVPARRATRVDPVEALRAE